MSIWDHHSVVNSPPFLSVSLFHSANVDTKAPTMCQTRLQIHQWTKCADPCLPGAYFIWKNNNNDNVVWIRSDETVAQLCPIHCDPVDCSSRGFSVHGLLPGKNTGVDSHFFLQGIFPIQGQNSGLLHHRQILYRLSPQGSPHIVVWKWKSLSRVRLFVTPGTSPWNSPGQNTGL